MKLNVGVIFGGKSLEHEMSIITAVQAMQELNLKKATFYKLVKNYESK